MAKRKCQICGCIIEDNNDSIKYKTGYAHKTCFDIAMKVVVTEKKESLSAAKKKAPKPQKELKQGLTEEEYKDKVKLCEYIRFLTKQDVSTASYALIEDYKKKYKISYKEMYEDLVWFFDICEHAVEGDRVIAMVPYCHTEAQIYYKSIERSNASCQENLKNLPEMYKEKNVVVSNERRTNAPQLDIAAIGGDD